MLSESPGGSGLQHAQTFFVFGCRKLTCPLRLKRTKSPRSNPVGNAGSFYYVYMVLNTDVRPSSLARLVKLAWLGVILVCAAAPRSAAAAAAPVTFSKRYRWAPSTVSMLIKAGARTQSKRPCLPPAASAPPLLRMQLRTRARTSRRPS